MSGAVTPRGTEALPDGALREEIARFAWMFWLNGLNYDSAALDAPDTPDADSYRFADRFLRAFPVRQHRDTPTRGQVYEDDDAEHELTDQEQVLVDAVYDRWLNGSVWMDREYAFYNAVTAVRVVLEALAVSDGVDPQEG